MALIKVDGEQAIRTQNKQRKWPSSFGTSAETLRPVVRAYYEPRIKIEKSDTIFSMGSCFARSFEYFCPDWVNFEKTNLYDAQAQNKYNVYAILNQMRWSYGLDDIGKSYTGIFERGDGNWIDLHGCSLMTETPEDYDLNDLDNNGPRDKVVATRDMLNEHSRRIKDANFIILTAGLAEVWYDRETERVLNHGPAPDIVRMHPKRFEFQQLDFNEILSCYEEIYEILRDDKGDDFKLLLTVSPIPYTATFNPSGGAIASNCYSKSVQRAAVETMVARHQNIGYFPSYEIATISDNQYVWDHDLIHIKLDFLEYIMALALESLLSDTYLAEHPEISRRDVDRKMIKLFPQLGISEFLAPYLRDIEDMEMMREKVQDKLNEALEVQHMLQERESMIKLLSDERERLTAEKNLLVIEKLKSELGEAAA